MTQPYLPLEPEIAITSGQYASEVDILLGLSINLFLFFILCEGSVANETLIGTEFFLAAPGKGGFSWAVFPSFSDLFCVLRELWPLLGPYALLQVMVLKLRG